MRYRVGVAVLLLFAGVALLTFVVRGHLSEHASHQHEGKREGPEDKPERTAGGQTKMTPEQKNSLLRLARQTIEEVVTTGRMPEVDASNLSSPLTDAAGCFVTLQKEGQLRGCIGHIFPQEPLYRAVRDNARSAALEDPRFRPVQPEELASVEIEISVLTVPQALPFDSPEDLLGKLRPHVDGVVLKIGQRHATFLPQVWEQLPDKEDFLSRLAVKAGFPPSAWKGPGVSVLTYQVEAFKESEM